MEISSPTALSIFRLVSLPATHTLSHQRITQTVRQVRQGGRDTAYMRVNLQLSLPEEANMST